MNAPEIDRMFEKLRAAEHGAIIKLELPDSGEPVEAIIFEPPPPRPPGYESGVFIMIPSETGKVFYLDPEASRKKGRFVLKTVGPETEKNTAPWVPEALLAEFEHIRQAPDVKRGGGTTGEACSKDKGVVDTG